MVKVPIVDAALLYDCKCTMNTYLLIMRNVIYIPSMENNIITPFIISESGLLVNYVASIHFREDVSHESRSIIFK